MRKIRQGKKIYCKKGSKLYEAWDKAIKNNGYFVIEDEVWINNNVYFKDLTCFFYKGETYSVEYVIEDKGVYLRKIKNN